MAIFTKTKKINDFGVFHNYSWPTDLKEFERFNLIYGWNGTGKTTLSRVFRSIELGEKHVDFPTSSFIVETSQSGLSFSDSNLSQSDIVRVFNVDFVEENIRWKETETNPVLFVGKDNADISKEIEEKSKQHKEKENEVLTKGKEYRAEKSKYDSILTDKARDIKSALVTSGRRDKFSNYNRRSLETTINSYSPEKKKALIKLSDTDLLDKNRIIQGTSLAKIQKVNCSIPNFDKIIEVLTEYGSTKVVSKVIDELQKDAKVSSWVESGLKIYREDQQQKCYFCGAEISEDRIKELEAHFSDEYDKFIASSANYKKTLQEKKVEVIFPAKEGFYSDLRSDYEESQKCLKKRVDDLNASLDKLVKFVDKKSGKPFDTVDIEEDDFNGFESSALESSLNSLNDIITNHNKKSDNFDDEVAKAKIDLEEHYISLFFKELTITKANKDKYKNELDLLEKNRDQLKSDVDALKKKLSSHGLAVVEFNTLLSKFLGRDDICITLTERDGFEFSRRGFPAKNLSEGEKTAIAFIYFIIKLKEKGFKKEEAVIVIDDPISSLDGNSLFGAFAFMQEHVRDAQQVIILTHNFYFLKRVVKWFKKIPRTSKKRYFMLNTESDSERRTSKLVEMDELLKGYHSEYHYLFRKLYDYSQTNNQNLEYYYGVPNLARKFMETFLGFKDPRAAEISNKFDKLNYDFAKKRRIISFLHANSHSGQEGIETFDISLLNETPVIIKEMLELIENIDKDHFDGLMGFINGDDVEVDA